MDKKYCSKCKKIKNINEFGFDKNRKSLHQAYCKICKNITMKEWRNNNPDRDILTQKKSYINNKHKYRNKQILRSNKWKEKNKKAVIAHILVSKAIKTGKIKRINKCEICHKNKNTVGHHDDYNYPYKIKWLCRSCHRKFHNSLLS